MEALVERGVDSVLRERVALGRPTLAICLGMQLLGTDSEESPGVRGVAAFSGSFARYRGTVRVPHIGWNRVETSPNTRILASGDGYFANSFRLEGVPAGWDAAWSEHDGAFVAGLERGAVVATQFHPELSGEFGAALIERWTLAARREVRAC